MPGIPCVYYGSEWGAKADKSQGDPALRPSFKEPELRIKLNLSLTCRYKEELLKH